MIATVGMHQVEVSCHIGVPAAERGQAQNLWVDVALDTDIAAAADSDRLRDTIDYNQIVAVLHDVAKAEWNLLEAFSEELARRLLLAFPAVLCLTLEVRKPHAIAGVGDCYVRLERRG
jgi:dihydroneopterin aldolase